MHLLPTHVRFSRGLILKSCLILVYQNKNYFTIFHSFCHNFRNLEWTSNRVNIKFVLPIKNKSYDWNILMHIDYIKWLLLKNVCEMSKTSLAFISGPIKEPPSWLSIFTRYTFTRHTDFFWLPFLQILFWIMTVDEMKKEVV